MFRFAPYVFKTLWRHRTRTLLTVSGSAVALFVFCFIGSVQEGFDELTRRREAEQSLVIFQANRFCPATSHLPQDYEGHISRMSGVREVVPIQVFTNNCRASLDTIVYYGLPADKVRSARDFRLLSGDWRQFEQNQDSAVFGQAVAKRLGVTVGDTFKRPGVTVFVAGVFASENKSEENYIYTHLSVLQRRPGENLAGSVTQFEVLLDNDADADAMCRQIDAALSGGPVQTDTRPKGVFQAKSLGDLTELIGLAHYLGYACVGLVLALVATTTIMAVQDRVREHAVLQTIGFSGRRVFRLVVWESVLLSAAGGAIGVALAMGILVLFPMSIGAEAVAVPFTPSLRLAATGLAVALATGVLAGALPAWHAARAEIVPALRHV